MIGTYLLHYKLLKKIGEGGQGEVYQAEDTRLRRIVAIKILPAELVADEKTRKRFLREAQLASALDHPNICTVYEINEDRGLHFIVMQYLEGKRLKQMVRGRALDVESTLSIAVQLADALAAAMNAASFTVMSRPPTSLLTTAVKRKFLTSASPRRRPRRLGMSRSWN